VPCQAIAGVIFEVKGWTGKTYYKKDGRLSFCEASKTYTSGDKIIFVMWADKRLALVYETGVRFKKARKYHSAIYVDKKPIGKGNGMGAARGSIVFSLPSTRNTFSSLYNGNSIQIKTQSTSLKSYTLAGSAAALLKLKECVSIRGSSPGLSSQKGFPSSSPRFRNVKVIPARESIALLTSMLNASGIAGYTLLPLKANSSYVDFNSVDGSVNIFLAYREATDPNLPNRRINRLISIISKDCKGRFISGKDNIPSTDGSIIRKAAIKCLKDDHDFISEVLVIQKPNGLGIELTTMYTTYPNSIPKPDRSIRDGAILNTVLKSKNFK